ncbi:hypothetical protein JB92DRAFT_916349 [Gautieria morchelliformis]|nr:hypothetical protein JB92DRAFT_916349 [Gautieria morchelliformis]
MLEHLESISEDIVKLESTSVRSVSLHSRRLYAECRLLHSLLELRDPDVSDATEDKWERAVTRLDMAIIIVGAPGEGLLDLILDTIEVIQAEYLPMRDCPRHIALTPEVSLPSVDVGCLASNIVPRIPPPSVSTFRRNSALPFILSGFINDWPALTNHPWNSPAYLLRVSGRGRVVPVEVGSDYRTDDWKQKILPWEVFLRGIGVTTDPHNEKKNGSEYGSQFDVAGIGKEALYLAQHTLLTQFPALRSDIVVPDYVYSSPLPPSTFPMYHPPGNDGKLVINAWLGPMGTLSPAHTDPYFNCYAQVVGRKTVWLAPPQFDHEMYPFSHPNAPNTTRSTPTLPSDKEVIQQTTPSLSNTSRVDVFTPATLDATPFPLFEEFVRPSAFCAVLQPGDLLYIPPGWWHAMRSEDVSFSVSMWF